MQKISLLPSNSMQQPSLGISRKNAESTNKRFKVTTTGSGKTVKKSVSETRPLERKNRNRLETKSSLIRKPFVSKTDNKVKRNLDSNQKNKAAEKQSLDKTRPTIVKKESTVQKSTSLKKEVSRKPEGEKRTLSKLERTNTQSKEKSSVDSEFRKKFNSIVPKNINESKIPTTSSQKSKPIVEKATNKSSIFKSKSSDKPTLQIETWGPAQAPKPLFNVSKAVIRTYAAEKKSVPEKMFPQPENVMRRISKQMTAERLLEKPIVPKIWKF